MGKAFDFWGEALVAQVQGRALGVAEAMRCIGVPCNAQIGAGGWRTSAWLTVALFGLTRRAELSAARVMPAGGVNDDRA